MLLAGRAVVKPEGQAGRAAISCVSAQGIVAAARLRLISVRLSDTVHADQAKLTCLCQARSSLKKLREDLSSKLENRQGDKQHAQVTGAFLGR